MTKANLLKLLHAIADKKDVEFFDSDKWILLSKGWEGMSELLFYIEEVSNNYKNFRIKSESKFQKLQISNIYKQMDDIVMAKKNKLEAKSILKLQAENILCQMLVELGHKKLVVDYNKIL